MGGNKPGKGHLMRFTASKETKAMELILKDDLTGRGISCVEEGEGLTCEGTLEGVGESLKFRVEACPVIDEVSVVTFNLKEGDTDAMYNLFCAVAHSQKDHIQGK